VWIAKGSALPALANKVLVGIVLVAIAAIPAAAPGVAEGKRGSIACDGGLIGSAAADSLVGSDRSDRINGGDGRDRLVGLGGDDCLAGGAQPDTIVPGAGDDLVIARRGDDRIEARDGHRDDVRCGPGRDSVVADPVDDLGGCERVTRQPPESTPPETGPGVDPAAETDPATEPDPVEPDPIPEPSPPGDPLPRPAGPCDRSAVPADLAAQISAAASGQVICLASGNYGTWTGTSKAIVLRATEGAVPLMRFDFTTGDANFTVDGVSGAGGSITGSAHDITVRNSSFNTTLAFDGPVNSHILFDHNVHSGINAPAGAPNAMITLHYESSQHSGITIQNSLFQNGDADGIHPSIAVDILNNTFRNLCDTGGNHTDNIQYQGANGGRVAGNYVYADYACPTQGITSYDSGTHNVVIEDNVIDIRRPWGLEWYSDDSSIIRHNTIVWHPASQCFFNVACGRVSLTSKTRDPMGTGTEVYDNLALVDIERATVDRNDHNVSAQNATYVGPTTTYAGHRLATGSVGDGAASDGWDVGIR